jgi:HSP20 family protein
MSLVSWEPYRDFLSLRDNINRMFEDAARIGPAPSEMTASAWGVPVDIYETRDEIVVRAEAPGIDPKDIKISLIGDQLQISGLRQREAKTEGRNYVRVERRYGSFTRSFTLNVPIVADQVKASYKDGILEVHLPKAEEVKPKEINIDVGQA